MYPAVVLLLVAGAAAVSRVTVPGSVTGVVGSPVRCNTLYKPHLFCY